MSMTLAATRYSEDPGSKYREVATRILAEDSSFLSLKKLCSTHP